MVKYVPFLFPLFFLICCGGDSSSESFQTKTTTDSKPQIINVSDPDSMISDYQHLRQTYIENEFGTETEVSLQGELYYRDGDYMIINFSEKWTMEYILFAVVVNPKFQINQLSDEDNDFGNLPEFLEQHLPENVAFYYGNFEDAPDYQIVDYKPVLLTNHYDRNNFISSQSTLYLLGGRFAGLEPTSAIARTEGYGGECEQFKGYREEFVMGSDLYTVTILREENSYYDGCELEAHFSYQKMWPEEYLLGMSEGGPSKEVPTYFTMPFVKTKGFIAAPKSFRGLTIQNGDTLINDSIYEFAVYRFGSLDVNAITRQSDYFSVAVNLMLDFKVNPNGSFTVFDRSVGMNADGEVTDINSLVEAEQNQSFIELEITLLDTAKGIYQFSYPDTGYEHLYTIKPGLFKEEEIDDQL